MQPNTFGMIQDEQVLEERLEKIETPRPRTDQNDTLYIKNIDEGCSETTHDVIRISERWRDPETGRTIVRFKDQTSIFEHAEGFTVKYSAQPFTIPPGAVMRMPRFLGEHFAKKLADHMLDKMGVEKMLRNDIVQRPAMLKRIIIKEEPFVSMISQTVGGEVAQMVQDLNTEPPVDPFVNADGNVYNTQGQKGVSLEEGEVAAKDMLPTATGDLRVGSIESTDEVINRLGTETPEDSLNVPEQWQSSSKSDIIKLIRDMAPDFKFGSNYNKAQLVGILQRM